jgi:alpha-mannosidase
MATYNWDVGTIERPNAEPKKFEVPSHQWIDLTDMSGTFGATILTDCKNGSDKPNDNTIRLTLIRTPGILGGYDDQATQDIGHHEFTYGLIGHEGDWRESGSDWQGLRLNDPLIAFQSSRHPGKLGRNFSLLRVSNARIRVMALKKAEDSDEIVLRLVELDGKPQPNVKITFSAPIISAHEISGQEEPVGPANVSAGSLLTSFTAYQPKTWAIKLGPPLEKLALTKSEVVPLKYDLAVATTDGTRSTSGFDGHGNSLPAEMLPQQITFDNVQFHLNPATTNSANALTANGQTLDLPSGRYNRMYLIAASSDGDQKVAFSVDEKETDLTIQQWGGFIGQWDNRQWIAKDKPIPGSDHKSEHDNYAEMTGVTPGYIKRSDVAWYCSHHHDAAGKNVSYSYSYLFAYSVDLPPGAKTLRLPNNDKIRILAISVAEEPPILRAVQPLYDLLLPRDVSSRESKGSKSARSVR